MTKLAAEKMCLAFGRLYGWKVACLRYFNVYGEDQRYDAYGNVIPIFARMLLDDRPLTIYGDGEQIRDFVHVDDVAGANWSAYESGATGAFNSTSPRGEPRPSMTWRRRFNRRPGVGRPLRTSIPGPAR